MVHSSVNNFTKGNFKQSLKEQLALKPSFVLSDWEDNNLISEKQEKHKEVIFHIQRIFKMKVIYKRIRFLQHPSCMCKYFA